MFQHTPILRLSLSSSLLWSIALPLWSCPISPAQITQIFESTPMLEQRSELSDRCDYSWARDNQDQLKATNAETLKRGAGKDTNTTPLWNQLILEHYQTTNSEAAALAALKKMVNEGPAPKFGSPDPLTGLGFKPISANAAWDKQANVLLFAKGKHLYRLQLKIFTLKPEELQIKALAVSEALRLVEGT